MIKISDLNPDLLNAYYAVRGPITDRAYELETQGRKIIYCNIGNPQALKQKPLTYLRQILCLLEYPELINSQTKIFPNDIIQKAKAILRDLPHGTGAYTQSAGIAFIRQAAADFISKRDGISADANNIILTDGASKGVQAVILALRKSRESGFMIPIPQYPLYSATISLFGASQIGYNLDESNEWQLNENILNNSIEQGKRAGITPAAIAVINPSNPTGAVLSHTNVGMIIKFAKTNNLAVMADEVYQENIYDENSAFHSFAKVMNELQEEEVPLFSFHSVSKGFLGECGHRGGYMEMRNVPADVRLQIIKLQSVSLCPNVDGQLATYLMVCPPNEGDESYDLYVRERDRILSDLKEKAYILARGLNKAAGMHADVPHGAMYAFVSIELPHTQDVTAMSPEARYEYDCKRDTDYCMALLEETGICVVPGSGFGQMPGSLHFRITILPPKDEMEDVAGKIAEFHKQYVERLKGRKVER